MLRLAEGIANIFIVCGYTDYTRILEKEVKYYSRRIDEDAVIISDCSILLE